MKKLADKLTFANADQGIIITPDINLHRELKLRLLNGTHTLSCAPAFLAGCSTVKQAMDHQTIAAFITSLMRDEIGLQFRMQYRRFKPISFQIRYWIDSEIRILITIGLVYR
jgi:tagaturonate reductase